MNNTKPKAIFVHNPNKKLSPFRKLETVLQKLCELQVINSAGVATLEDLFALVGTSDLEVPIYLDADWICQKGIEFQESKRVIFLVEAEPVSGPCLLDWRKNASFISIYRIANTELPRIAQLTLAPSKYPGISLLCEKGSEIFFEKILSLSEVGQKIDRVQLMLEKQQPSLTHQYYNFRQLSYSLLYEGFLASSSVSKFLPVVDFQFLANTERLVFSARFKAPAGSLEQWRENLLCPKSLNWRNLGSSADLLALIWVENRCELEIKAILSREGDHSVSSSKSLLVKSIEGFLNEIGSYEDRQEARFLPLDALSADPKKSVPKAAGQGPEFAKSIEKNPTFLQQKLKAEMLEKENLRLLELIRKKTQLIAGLNKEVGQAQLGERATENGQARELQKLRLSEEKTKKDLFEVTKKLLRLQKKIEDEASKAPDIDEMSVPRQNFEKEWKQAEFSRRQAEEKLTALSTRNAHKEETIAALRKENRELLASAEDSKASIHKLEKKLQFIEGSMQTTTPLPATTAIADPALAEKLKETQRLLNESTMKEGALEKELKRLTMKTESAEKNLRVITMNQKKQADIAEKALEEAKRQKSEAIRKLEEKEMASKRKLEESNETERRLKARIEELSAAQGEAKKKVA